LKPTTQHMSPRRSAAILLRSPGFLPGPQVVPVFFCQLGYLGESSFPWDTTGNPHYIQVPRVALTGSKNISGLIVFREKLDKICVHIFTPSFEELGESLYFHIIF